MKNFVIGVLLATLAVFAWGFIYWGASGVPYRSLTEVSDVDGTREAMETLFPSDGVYYIPGIGLDDAAMMEKYEEGPVAMVHMLARDGAPAQDPTVFAKAFILNLVFAILIALLLQGARLPSYRSRLQLAVLAGLAAAIYAHGNGFVWWKFDATWQFHLLFSDFISWVVAALILARFIKPNASAAA